MSPRHGRIDWTLASIVVLVIGLLFSGNLAFATNPNKAEGAQQTVVAKSVILAALADTDKSAGIIAPAARDLSTGNIFEKQSVAPRSEWIRVAPLVTKTCCGGYTCDQRSGTCVCKRWC